MAKMKYYKPKFNVRFEKSRFRSDDEILVGLLTKREIEKNNRDKLRKLLHR